MQTFSIVFSIILLIVGILQIILFFKLWGMTNNVRRITTKIASRSQRNLVREVLKGGSNAENTLFDYLYADLCNTYDEGYGGFEDVIRDYKKIYEQVGIAFPSVFENIETHDDFNKILNLEKCR